MNTGPLPEYTVFVRGVPKTFHARDAAAAYAVARKLEGETDIAYACNGSEPVRHQREAGLIAKIEELLAKKGTTL